MKLFLDDEIIKDLNLSAYGFMVYVSLRLIIRGDTKEYYVNPKLLWFSLTGNIELPRRALQNITAGLEELIQMGLIKQIYCKHNDLIYNLSLIYLDKSKKKNFTILYPEEIKKIYCSKCNNKANLLRYLSILVGTFNGNIKISIDGEERSRIISFPTINSLSKVSGYSISAIVDYNSDLEKLGLISIIRQNDFSLEDNGNIKNFPNIYCRPCDKIYAISYAKSNSDYNTGFRYRKNGENQINLHRRYAQEYISLHRGKEYPPDELTAIYNYIVSTNKKYEKLISEGHEYYRNRIRDLSIFGKYNLSAADKK